MSEFIELLRESVIIQGLITLSLIITLCIMVATSTPLPPFFTDLVSLVLGFYFGAKVQSLVHKAKG